MMSGDDTAIGGASGPGRPGELRVAHADADAGPLLSLRHVELSYATRTGRVHALSDISLSVGAGELVCLVGPSGCGKSTLLRIVGGFLAPSSGAVTVDGQAVRAPGADRGMVFQQPALYPWLSVGENVAFGPRMRGVPRQAREARVEAVLRLVGLHEFTARAPWELSGGMQQRAAIARVLINEPRIMLMDEPFGALDVLTRDRMQEELLKMWRATRTTIILVTHSVEEAVYLGTRTVVMSPRPGRILVDVPTAFSRVPADSRAIKSSKDFIDTREAILSHIRTPSD
jgi:taurine transport system ATP-binding protein